MPEAPKRELSVFDAACLIAGIIVGTGIYVMPPDVAKGVGAWWGVMLLWAAGGLISLAGALGYAELASAYPRAGGDYVYLARAYGPWAGFLFGWVQLVIVRPADIAVMAWAFATYARKLWDPMTAHGASEAMCSRLYASLAVAALTLVNVLGVRLGKWAQNVLTVVKVVGLVLVVALAFGAGAPAAASQAPYSLPLGLAMIFVLFTYGGWNEMAYVAAEVKDPHKNILRAMVLGIAVVIGVYLAINAAFLVTLGHGGLAASGAVAAEAAQRVWPGYGSGLISALVCVSALGAVNGLIFAGARISYALGADHRLFRLLGRWHAATGTPLWALLLQGLIAVAVVVLLASFGDMILYTAAVVYSFYLATNLAVIVLRFREPQAPRPYRVTGYPFTTAIFCAVCAYLIYRAVDYRPHVAAAGVGIMLLGLPLYWLTRFAQRREANP